MRIEIDFISSMIEIPRSRPRNADRTKHGGEGEIDLTSRTAQSGSAWEPPGMNLMLSYSSSSSFSAFGRMFREIRLPQQQRTDADASDGREDAQRRWPRWHGGTEIKTAQSRRLIRRFEPGSCLARRFMSHHKSLQKRTAIAGPVERTFIALWKELQGRL